MIPDTKGFDMLLTYADREAVLYRDKLQGKYEAETAHHSSRSDQCRGSRSE